MAPRVRPTYWDVLHGKEERFWILEGVVELDNPVVVGLRQEVPFRLHVRHLSALDNFLLQGWQERGGKKGMKEGHHLLLGGEGGGGEGRRPACARVCSKLPAPP